MDFSTYIDFATKWITENSTHLIITLVVLLLFVVVNLASAPKIKRGADQGNFKAQSADKPIRIVQVITAIICLLILTMVWGIHLSAIFIFASTTITILGAALFANWSLLSNVTAYFVLFLHPTFKRGTFVRIIDADNYAEGYISEITLFNTKLVTENREVIVYPNILLLGRPVLVNPRDRLNTLGKIQAMEEKPTTEKIESNKN